MCTIRSFDSARSWYLIAFSKLRLSEKIRCLGHGKPFVGVEDKSWLMVAGFYVYVSTKTKECSQSLQLAYYATQFSCGLLLFNEHCAALK